MKDIFPAFLLSAAMGSAVYALSLLGLGNLVTLILQVLLGAVIYVGVSAMLKLEPFQYLLGIAGKLLNRE